MNRNQAYKLLGIASKHFSDDEEYRAFLARFGATRKGGRISASTMTLAQLADACHQCKQLGFLNFVSGGRRKSNNNAQTRKCYALWCALFDSGKVVSKEWVSMELWCQNHAGFQRGINSATAYQLNQCIEGLKQWLNRR